MEMEYKGVVYVGVNGIFGAYCTGCAFSLKTEAGYVCEYGSGIGPDSPECTRSSIIWKQKPKDSEVS